MVILKLLWAGATYLTARELVRFALAPEHDDEDDGDAEDDGDDDDTLIPELDDGDDPDQPDVYQHTEQSLGLSAASLALAAVSRAQPAAKVLGIPVLVMGMMPTIRDARASLFTHKRLDFSVLATVGTVLEIGLGYWELSALGWVVYTAGEYLQKQTRRQIEHGFNQAIDSTGGHAWIERDGIDVQVLVKDIPLDARVVVRAGDAVPVDGHIIEGAIAVDQRALTGESRLCEQDVGDKVLATTLVLSGHAVIRPERTGSETVAARVENLLVQSRSYEQGLRHQAEREANRSARPSLALMAVSYTTGGWYQALLGYWTNSIELSWFGIPYSTMNTTEAAARAAIMIKDGRSLDELTRIDTIVFDKTGTLTRDSLTIAHVHVNDGFTEHDLLGLAAAVEQRQQHPIARAIVHEAQRRGVAIREPDELSTTVGYGLRARIGGRDVAIGSARLMRLEGVAIVGDDERAERADALGHSLIHIAVDGGHAGTIELAPELRPELPSVLQRLRARGLELMIVSGDGDSATAALAETLGISSYRARALPEDKAAIVAELQRQGRRVCFVGDGLNDGLALRRANVSVSMSEASSVAVKSAQILLRANSLEQLDTLFTIAEQFGRERRVITGIARGITVTSGLALLFVGIELQTLVSLYNVSLGVTLAVSVLPKLRDHNSASDATELAAD